MKQLTCEMCGSTDLIKQDGVFVCQSCGCKYSVEEAKKMMIEGTVEIQGTVQVDKKKDVNNLIKRIYMLVEDSDNEEAYNCCQKALNIDVECAEAYFALALMDAGVCNVNELKAESSDNEELKKHRRFLTSKNLEKAVAYAKNNSYAKKLIEEVTSIYLVENGIFYSKDKKYIYFVKNKKGIETITIPDGVTFICDYAFEYCASLTSIAISDSVTYIGDYAFYGCDNLKNLIIGNGVNSINWVKYCKKSLTNITIGNGVTSIDDSAFRGCDSLTSITIPDSVTSIGCWAFNGCASLTSVIIPDSVTFIGYDAFSGCKNLTSVTIGNGVTFIRSSTFKDCTSLTSVTIPESVISIDNNAFDRNTRLIKVKEEKMARYRQLGVCQHCGGEFKGFIKKRCTKCGREKDYSESWLW